MLKINQKLLPFILLSKDIKEKYNLRVLSQSFHKSDRIPSKKEDVISELVILI